MAATSKQDLHDFPDLSPALGAAQLLIDAKDYANHSNRHCIMSFQIETLSSRNTGFSSIKKHLKDIKGTIDLQFWSHHSNISNIICT